MYVNSVFTLRIRNEVCMHVSQLNNFFPLCCCKIRYFQSTTHILRVRTMDTWFSDFLIVHASLKTKASDSPLNNLELLSMNQLNHYYDRESKIGIAFNYKNLRLHTIVTIFRIELIIMRL